MLSKLTSITKICGIAKTRMGKSFLLKKIHCHYPRRIIIDRTKEYSENDGIICEGFNVFCEMYKQVWDLDQFTLIFRFKFGEGDKDKIFEQICMMTLQMQDVFLVVEEIHLFQSAHGLNDPLEEIATSGSHYNIGYSLTTQRPSLIHKTLLTQSDFIFIGALLDTNDIRYVKEFCGDQAENLVRFAPREFLMFDQVQNGLVSKINTNDLSFLK